ncbi:hypothetical protein [Paractinoplanes lichenicola]|uniref:Uncharacterized protein n=1 Tax=Paractinoplanes lichenicola TaxID=2802976 RepID=A0ABS1VRE6_9ACTN|nr:hypothetical protein [Actinoplanes lichenicola]MBL7257289.1 hypothetical protein [Actinoplanes lichenicola]
MQISYQVAGSPHTYETGPSEDLAQISREIEEHLRQSHPELARNGHLAEKITDGLLNGLAGDTTDVELGDLSS